MKIGVAEVRNQLAEVLNRVAYQGERVVLQRRGKGVAAIVPIEDYEFLEKYEDAYWTREAEKALAEMEASGEKPIPWEEAKRQLDALRGRGTKRRSRRRKTA